ncbi:hypothetical protein BH11MYX1_BH11MYX1_07650 [soil metagenome]
MDTLSISAGSPCLDVETLAAYVDGLLHDELIKRADQHIDGCASCRGELSALVATGSLAAGDDHRRRVLDGAPQVVEGKLGRYEIQRELGRGSMGVVVRAYDPELARSVAIKVLQPRLGNGLGVVERLRLEAQAMARISHANVVSVYDVTSYGDSIAITMELIEGDTLRTRIGYTRSIEELLAMCVLAGRGLAAAHGAKLIHRDFKPENVLCAADGRVLVSDFGLARLDDDSPLGASQLSATTTTTLAGTPAYMAPELLRGRSATAASDQFSFCVATWEVLSGERPFDGATLEELAAAIAVGPPRERRDRDSRRVPGRIRAALVRGLAPDPADRFASLTELLEILDAKPWSLRRRGAIGLGIALAAAVGLIVAVAAGNGKRSCDVDPSAIAWDRVAITRTLRDRPEAAARITAGLDAYARNWLISHRDACEATRVRGELSERVFDARMACLERGHRELGELVSLIALEPTIVDRASEAIEALLDPASCTADTAELPTAPELDRAEVLVSAGKFDDALALVTVVLVRDGATAIRPAALLLRGRIESALGKLEVAESSIAEAIPLAERAHADQLVAALWVELVRTAGAQRHHFEAAQADMRAAEAAFARADPGPALRRRYAYNVGTMLLAHGKLAEARPQLERALAAIPESHLGERAAAHTSLCDLERQQHHLDAARAHCQKAVELRSAGFGRDHPQLGVVYNIWGVLERDAGNNEAARARFEHAIALYDAKGEVQDLTLALALANAGGAWSDAGDIVRARPLYERARDLFAAYHPDHPQRILPLQGLASCALEQHDVRTAIRYYEESLAVIEGTYGKDSAQRTIVLFNLALAFQQLPDADKTLELTERMLDQAQHPGSENWAMTAWGLDLEASVYAERHHLKRAVLLRERALAALGHVDAPAERAWINSQLANTLRQSGQPGRAIPPLENALAYYEAHRINPYDNGLAHLALARALWEQGHDRKRAIAMAKAARDDLAEAKSGRNLEPIRAEVARWLQERNIR